MSRRVVAAGSSLALLGAFIVSVPAALAGGGCHAGLGDAVHADGTTSVVRMDVCSFEPTVARVPVGSDVTFLNTSTLEHAVLGRGQSWGGDANLRPGGSVVARFGEAGVFPYSCPLHPGMVGAVVVGDANTPPSAMGALVDGAMTQQEPAAAGAAPATGGESNAPTGGLEPIAAVGAGGLAGLVVLALGVLAVRRRPGSRPIPG